MHQADSFIRWRHLGVARSARLASHLGMGTGPSLTWARTSTRRPPRRRSSYRVLGYRHRGVPVHYLPSSGRCGPVHYLPSSWRCRAVHHERWSPWRPRRRRAGRHREQPGPVGHAL